MDSVIPFPRKTNMPNVWPFSSNVTVALGCQVTFWLGVLIGFLGAKGGLL